MTGESRAYKNQKLEAINLQKYTIIAKHTGGLIKFLIGHTNNEYKHLSLKATRHIIFPTKAIQHLLFQTDGKVEKTALDMWNFI